MTKMTKPEPTQLKCFIKFNWVRFIIQEGLFRLKKLTTRTIKLGLKSVSVQPNSTHEHSYLKIYIYFWPWDLGLILF